MMKIIVSLFFIIACTNTHAQCLSGNCENGKGKFDFGWCVYEGAFKNGKPDGEGKMFYDDYTYTGSFANGVEDGHGIIKYKNGKEEDVSYVGGKKLDAVVKIKKEQWKEIEGRDENCLTGDCNNGFGTYRFPSGNKYVGNFVNKKREGQGTFYFVEGDKFEGTFHNNEKSSGTYTYSNGAKYTGTYTSDGMEYNGTVSLNGTSIPFVSGKVIIPPKPKIVYAKATTPAPPKKPGYTAPAAGPSAFDRAVEANHKAVMQAGKDIQEMQKGFERQHERDRRGY